MGSLSFHQIVKELRDLSQECYRSVVTPLVRTEDLFLDSTRLRQWNRCKVDFYCRTLLLLVQAGALRVRAFEAIGTERRYEPYTLGGPVDA
jgi:hypothetical protein